MSIRNKIFGSFSYVCERKVSVSLLAGWNWLYWSQTISETKYTLEFTTTPQSNLNWYFEENEEDDEEDEENEEDILRASFPSFNTLKSLKLKDSFPGFK